jgi:hypothetical protein
VVGSLTCIGSEVASFKSKQNAPRENPYSVPVLYFPLLSAKSGSKKVIDGPSAIPASRKPSRPKWVGPEVV